MFRFDPENRDVLLAEERYQRLPPERVLDLLPLRPDAVVADIGCGPGYFTLPLAARLPEGHVYAADIEPLMLDTTRKRAATVGLTNVTTVLAWADGVPLAPGSVDGILLAFTYLFVPGADRVDYLTALRELLRPGGWLAILDWEKRQNPGGGPPLERRVTPEETETGLSTTGWRVAARHAPNEWTYLFHAVPEQ